MEEAHSPPRPLQSTLIKRFVGKAFGVNMFRHVYVTEFLAKNPSLLEKQARMKSMMQLKVERLESYARRG